MRGANLRFDVTVYCYRTRRVCYSFTTSCTKGINHYNYSNDVVVYTTCVVCISNLRRCIVIHMHRLCAMRSEKSHSLFLYNLIQLKQHLLRCIINPSSTEKWCVLDFSMEHWTPAYSQGPGLKRSNFNDLQIKHKDVKSGQEMIELLF